MSLNEFKNKFFKKANGCGFNLLPLFQDYSVFFDAPGGGRIDVTSNYCRDKFEHLHFCLINKDSDITSYSTLYGDETSLSEWLEAVEDSGVLDD